MQVGALSRVVAVAAAAFMLLAAPAAAQSPVPVRVISFGGGFNLPLWVGQARGFFAANGVDVTLSTRPIRRPFSPISQRGGRRSP